MPSISPAMPDAPQDGAVRSVAQSADHAPAGPPVRGMTAMVSATVALGPLTMSMYTPSMPAITQALNASPGMVQATLSIYLVGFAFAQLVYGPLSDRFGRRRMLLGGLGIFLVGTAACGFAQSIEVLLAARLVQAVGACAGPTLGRAMVRDLFAREQAARALAFVGMALAVAPAFGPLAGGYLQVWFDWHAIFAALGVAGLLLAVLVATRLPETNRNPDPGALAPGRIAANYAALVRSRRFLGYTAVASCTLGSLFTFQAVAPFLVIDLVGLAPQLYGWASMITVAGYLAGSFVATRVGTRLGIDRQILVSAALSGAGLALLLALALAGVVGVLAIMAPMALVTMGMGLALPASMAGAMAPFPRIAGASSALLGFAQMAVGALGSVAVARLGAETTVPAALVLASMGVGGYVAWAALVWRHREAAR